MEEIVPALVILFIAGVSVYAFMTTYPVLSFFIILIGSSALIYRIILKSKWLDRWEQQAKAAALEKEREAKAEAIKREWETTPWQIPTPEQFRAEVSRGADATMHPAFRDNILQRQMLVYRQAAFHAKQSSVAQTKSHYYALQEACIKGINNLTAVLPFKHQQTSSPFLVTRTITPQDIAPFFTALAEPTREPRITGFFPNFTYSIETPKEPESLNNRYRSYINSGIDDEDIPSPEKLKRDYEKEKKEYDTLIKKGREQMTALELALEDSPYYQVKDHLLPTEPIQEHFSFPDKSRFAGTWIIAPPSKGKTNLLWQLVNQDLDGSKTVIMMDSKGDFINPFRNHPDAIVIDYNNAAINPFQLGGQSAMEFLRYIFSSLLEVQMTGLQKTLFSAIIEVLLHTPNATIEHFRHILNYGVDDYQDALAQCGTDTKNFFTLKPIEFNNSTYKDTKDQLRWRLRLLLQNEYLRRIFTSTHKSHDFIELLDSKKLIILDVSKKVLWDEGAEFFGRFFIAMVWMGAVARSDKPEHTKIPVHFYIDECQTVMKRDAMFRAIIQECRSQKIAITCAHQYIDDLTDIVKPALYNCAIRIANADDDASQVAPRLNTTADAVKLPAHHFACFVRDITPQAVTISVPFLDLSSIPQVPEDQRRIETLVEAPQRATEAPRLRVVPKEPTSEVEDF